MKTPWNFCQHYVPFHKNFNTWFKYWFYENIKNTIFKIKLLLLILPYFLYISSAVELWKKMHRKHNVLHRAKKNLIKRLMILKNNKIKIHVVSLETVISYNKTTFIISARKLLFQDILKGILSYNLGIFRKISLK